jgi:hypothetical protein
MEQGEKGKVIGNHGGCDGKQGKIPPCLMARTGPGNLPKGRPTSSARSHVFSAVAPTFFFFSS